MLCRGAPKVWSLQIRPVLGGAPMHVWFDSSKLQDPTARSFHLDKKVWLQRSTNPLGTRFSLCASPQGSSRSSESSKITLVVKYENIPMPCLRLKNDLVEDVKIWWNNIIRINICSSSFWQFQLLSRWGFCRTCRSTFEYQGTNFWNTVR